MALFGSPQISTQEHLELEDIRDDLVILKNGTVSLVMETTALNFELLSEREQDSKILAFAALLNSLTYQIQIVIKTERTDISGYIDRLRTYHNGQASPALRRQIEIYMAFINNLTVNTEVLDKRFFIVIPEAAAVVEKTSMLKQIFGKKTKITNIRSILERAKVRVYPKRDHLMKQFKRIGIVAKQLTTDELIRLYYSMYDPDKSGLSKLELSRSEFSAGMVTSLNENNEQNKLSQVKQ